MRAVLGLLFALPLAPVRGLTGLARLLRDQAERELRDPINVHRELTELADARRRPARSRNRNSRGHSSRSSTA